MDTQYPSIHAYVWQRITRTPVTQKHLPDNTRGRLQSYIQVTGVGAFTQQLLDNQIRQTHTSLDGHLIKTCPVFFGYTINQYTFILLVIKILIAEQPACRNACCDYVAEVDARFSAPHPPVGYVYLMGCIRLPLIKATCATTHTILDTVSATYMRCMANQMPCRDMIDRLLRTYSHHRVWCSIMATTWPRDAPIVFGDLTCTAPRMFHIHDSQFQDELYRDAKMQRPRTATLCWDHQRHQHTCFLLRDQHSVFQNTNMLFAAVALGMNRLMETGVITTQCGLDPDLIEATFECCPYNHRIPSIKDS